MWEHFLFGPLLSAATQTRPSALLNVCTSCLTPAPPLRLNRHQASTEGAQTGMWDWAASKTCRNISWEHLFLFNEFYYSTVSPGDTGPTVAFILFIIFGCISCVGFASWSTFRYSHFSTTSWMIHFMPLGLLLPSLDCLLGEIFVDTFLADTGRDLVGLLWFFFFFWIRVSWCSFFFLPVWLPCLSRCEMLGMIVWHAM